MMINIIIMKDAERLYICLGILQKNVVPKPCSEFLTFPLQINDCNIMKNKYLTLGQFLYK